MKWFLETIGPFRHLWQSVLVRATWSHLDGEDRILSISITLESLAPKLLRPPAVRPDVGPLRTAWQAFDIAHLESLVDEFATGSIQVEGRKLLLESHTGSKWDKWSSLHQAFDRPEGSPYSTSRLPTVRVHDFNSGSSSAYESVTDSALALQLRALHVPFENMQDVLESFLGIPRSQRDQNLIIVSIRAEIPIHFGEASIHDGKLKAKVSMPKRADLQKVSVGLIESAPDRVIRRSTVPIAPKTWKKVGDQWQASIDQSAAPGTTKALLFLNYSGIFIGQKSVIALQSDSGNPGMRLHELLDRDNQQLLKCLAGQGKRRDEHFEQAVSWLFGFCGFHTQLYAHFLQWRKRPWTSLHT
ncbi:MAG: hypothetical protein M0D55_15105 [Elusimicrobiota bacterium]|nr:MAG: hypothetical protein M0D55_15105 [Elusimicrobiota bacterium]